MKKRWYALIPALILLVVLIGIVGWKIGHPAENTQPEYSLTIADPVTTEISSSAVVTEQTTVSSGRTTKAASESRTTASTGSPAVQTSKTKKSQTALSSATATTTAEASRIDQDGTYTSKNDVALYIHTYGKLPSNFISKKQARLLGWEGGSLEPYAPGKSIGGDSFGNFEGLLPSKQGRRYTECDIDTKGKSSRGSKRIVFSNDGLIYYTGDHYKTFELLYGEE